MGIIKVSGIKLYAYHGCLEEEAKIGCNYIVDVAIETDLTEAASKDDLSKTVDYVRVYQIVKSEMAIRSKLIEHVAKRIADKLKKNISQINAVEVKVTKLNPPVNGEIESASVIFTAPNKKT
jgi:7,8-dihydroneopterin aldolase/epimerase/oxygenase